MCVVTTLWLLLAPHGYTPNGAFAVAPTCHAAMLVPLQATLGVLEGKISFHSISHRSINRLLGTCAVSSQNNTRCCVGNITGIITDLGLR